MRSASARSPSESDANKSGSPLDFFERPVADARLLVVFAAEVFRVAGLDFFAEDFAVDVFFAVPVFFVVPDFLVVLDFLAPDFLVPALFFDSLDCLLATSTPLVRVHELFRALFSRNYTGSDLGAKPRLVFSTFSRNKDSAAHGG